MAYTQPKQGFLQYLIETSLATVKTLLFMSGYVLLFMGVWSTMQGSEFILTSVVDGSLLQIMSYASLVVIGSSLMAGILTASVKTFGADVQNVRLQLHEHGANKRRTI